MEIGTEEIPAGYLEEALGALRTLLESGLAENRIAIAGGVEVYGTPRRLVLIGKQISQRQSEMVREVTGPPVGAAYDREGKPTKAAMGFAEKQGVPVEALGRVTTAKGEYVFVRREVPGRPTLDVVSELLPRIVSQIPWPKSMRWGGVGFPFVRPIHWILALFDGQTVPFELAGIRSGASSFGHRFMAPEAFHVRGVEDYLGQLERRFILVDQRERERVVERIAREAAASVGGEILPDPELISTVANLVEYPSAVCGHFGPEFLAIPEPVLVTAMREHQKYFAVKDREGALMAHFVAINNTLARDPSVVRRGHERVLRARLSDAAFFFKEDRKRPLEARLEELKGVIYQADLGTSHGKVARFTRIAESLARELLPGELDGVRLACKLCKCDLVTQMVSEFPSLQGTMGMAYARIEGYEEKICRAIHEHYLPTKAGGELPASAIGAVVGVADRVDTIAGCFAVGLEPTGATDPFALRRHALAILRILEARGWNVSVRGLVEKALAILEEEVRFDRRAAEEKAVAFILERYKHLVQRAGYAPDLVDAVLATGSDRIPELGARIAQLKRFTEESEDFKGLAMTFKRVSNILKSQTGKFRPAPELLGQDCERELLAVLGRMKVEVARCIEVQDFHGALRLMVGLKGPVDAFFDGVEILTKQDPGLREARVGLLQELAGLFLSVADLSKIEG
jgi:glycyl-tRNA synthetase beta chain